MDMRFGPDESFTILSAFISTIKYLIVSLFKVRSVLYGHGATNNVIGFRNFLICESEILEHIEIKSIEFSTYTEDFFTEGLAQNKFIECKCDVEHLGQFVLNFRESIIGESFCL